MNDSCKNKLIETFKNLQLLNSKQRFNRVVDSIKSASELILQEQSFFLEVIDKTNAGGLHKVTILVDPKEIKAYIEIPEEPEEIKSDINTIFQGMKGGRNPTIYHGIEILTESYQLAEQEFPNLAFGLAQDNYLSKLGDLFTGAKKNTLIIPLTIDPPITNVMIFHTQVPHVNPETLARGWYQVIKLDQSLVKDIIRHTILVMPISPSPEYPNANFGVDQPRIKNQVFTEVLPNEVVGDRSRFRPLHLNRISRWTTIAKLNQIESPRVERIGSRFIIHLS